MSGQIEVDLKEPGYGRMTPPVYALGDENRMKQLVEPDEIVIQDEKINILFRYPLSVEVLFEYESEGGFSRLKLLQCIYKGYKKIYDEEEAEVGDPGSYENLYNRKKSEGKYGIWGHTMEDLWLEGIQYDAESRTVHLRIGS